jgi:metallo-beta-lactamase family protein
MKLTFCGGAGEVTGSNYLLEVQDKRILIDCGLHQGTHYAERHNFEPFPYEPKSIEAVFVTHSHLDHVGLLPKLEKDGFQGKIYSTDPTRDCAELILLDSEHILGKEAEREAKPPLYVEADITRLMRQWHGVPYHQPVTVGPFTVTLFDAGHILGSASIQVEAEGKRIIFSGDLGNTPAPIIQPTEYFSSADYCLVESAYGDRVHENEDQRREALEDCIQDTARAGGTLIIPTFAMERTQELLYHMHTLFEEMRVPKMPVFIDSPLAIKLTAVYKKYEGMFNRDTKRIIRNDGDILNFPGLRLTLTTEQSKEINDVPPPKVIMAGSGMSQGGRILHHEMRYLPDPKSTILFVGFQTKGSLGRQILDGAKEVRIFGEPVPVRCHKVDIPGYSAHADQPRLLKWVGAMRGSLKRVFVVQGEEDSASVLAAKIRDTLAIRAEVPTAGESVEL